MQKDKNNLLLNNSNKYLLWIIVLLAAALRLVGLKFGLPYAYHQDEPIVVNHALAYANFDFNPHFFKIPPLLSYLLFGIYALLFFCLHSFANYTKETFTLLYFQDPTVFYVLGRAIAGVFFGTATVTALYILAKKNFGETTALLAAFFLCVNFLHIRDSHYIYVDIPMIFSIVLCLVYTNQWTEQRALRSFFFAAGWAGIAIAFKYIAAPIVFVFLAAALNTKTVANGSKIKIFFNSAIFVLVAGLVYLALNPFSVIDFGFFLKEIRQQAAAESAVPLFHHLRYSLMGGAGGFLTVLGITGLLTLCFKRPSQIWLWSAPFLYYAMISLFSQPAERYAMPLVPFLCLGAAYVFQALSGAMKGSSYKFIVIIALGAGIVFPTLSKAVYLDWLMTRADTRTQAKEWTEKNLSAGATLLLDHPSFSPRFHQIHSQLQEKTFLIEAKDAHAQLKSKKIQWLTEASANKKKYKVYFLHEGPKTKSPFLLFSPLVQAEEASIRRIRPDYFVRSRHPEESDFFDITVKPKARLLKVFSPYRDNDKIMTQDPWANVALPFCSRELFSRRYQGPYLEIYKVDFSS